MAKLTRDQRKTIILDIISKEKISNQAELIDEMRKRGHQTNQATMSRDLSDLRLIKVDGYYQTRTKEEAGKFSPRVTSQCAGDHLIILKTSPGQASFVAAILDEASLSEIAGTIAGDDTIFIAVTDLKNQKRVLRYLSEHF